MNCRALIKLSGYTHTVQSKIYRNFYNDYDIVYIANEGRHFRIQVSYLCLR
jgi:hypothetical protein